MSRTIWTYPFRQSWQVRYGSSDGPRPFLVFVNGGVMRYRTLAGAEACRAVHGGKVVPAW